MGPVLKSSTAMDGTALDGGSDHDHWLWSLDDDGSLDDDVTIIDHGLRWSRQALKP